MSFINDEELEWLRKEIDAADKLLVEAFVNRMTAVKKIGIVKAEKELPLRDELREKELLEVVAERSGEEYGEYTKRLYKTIFELSLEYQKGKFEG